MAGVAQSALPSIKWHWYAHRLTVTLTGGITLRDAGIVDPSAVWQ